MHSFSLGNNDYVFSGDLGLNGRSPQPNLSAWRTTVGLSSLVLILPQEIEDHASSTLVLKMADPFEVRMRFTKQLQQLNASVTATQKAAQYALKYKDMDEDLHSCIVEQLEQVKGQSHFGAPRPTMLNSRANARISLESKYEYTRQHHVLH